MNWIELTGKLLLYGKYIQIKRETQRTEREKGKNEKKKKKENFFVPFSWFLVVVDFCVISYKSSKFSNSFINQLTETKTTNNLKRDDWMDCIMQDR